MGHLTDYYAFFQSRKFEEAEKLQKQVLARAHEFGQISNENKTIRQIADEREQNKAQNVENQPLSDVSQNSPTVATTLKPPTAEDVRKDIYIIKEALAALEAKLEAFRK